MVIWCHTLAINFFSYVFFSAIWSLFSRWFRPKEFRENLWVTWAKIILSVILSNSLWLENTTVYLFVFAIAFYQIFIAFVHLVTWYLYRKNGIKPRGRYLFDGLWIGWFGLYSLSPFHNAADFELFLLGWYLISLGITRLRDGIFFEADLSKNQLKRRVRVTLPIFLTALVPASTLAKVNKFLQENAEESAEEAYNQVKSGKTAELELFIHTAETSLFSAIGHVDLCVLSTNCVLLADSIVGQAGTDILSPKGFIAPGTYQAYLDEEYEKPNSLVVSKSLY